MTPLNQPQSLNTPKKSGILKTLIAITAITSFVQAQANNLINQETNNSTIQQTSDLIAQCDFNGNKIIDGRTILKVLKNTLKSDGEYTKKDKEIYNTAFKNAREERKCTTKLTEQKIVQVEKETAQIEKKTAQKKYYIAKLDMSTDGLKKELQNLKKELEQLTEKDKQLTEKDKQLTEKDKQLTEKDKQLIKELEIKKQWLLEQIQYTQKTFT